MDQLALPLAALAAAASLGAILFQSTIVAGSIFSTLNADAAGRVLRAVFPRFFRFNLICALLVLAALVTAGAIGGWSTLLVWGSAAAVVMAAAMLAAGRLVPAINAARDEGASAKTRFARLHAISVLLTLLVLVFDAALLAAIGATSTGY